MNADCADCDPQTHSPTDANYSEAERFFPIAVKLTAKD